MRARFPRRGKLLAALALATTWLLHASGADAQFHTKGRWIGPDTLGLEGTHVIVMRDDDSTKVLLMGGNLSGIGQKLWSFRAGDSVSRPVLSGTGANLIPLPDAETGVNLFCSGHCILPDGRGIIVGGELASDYGTEDVFVIDPKYPGGTSQAWTRQTSMVQERWYGDATTVATGNVVATAGANHGTVVTFGGTTGSPYGGLVPLNLSRGAWWGVDSNPGAGGPSARSGHTALFPVQGAMVLFGGDANGDDPDGKLGDVWWAYGGGNDSTWSWLQPLWVFGDPTTGNLPERRSQHTAVLFSAPDLPAPDSVVVFGGQDSFGHALGDVWIGRYDSPYWRWYYVTVSGGPGARYGHTAVMDPGPPGSTDGSRMLVFGGRDANGNLADNTVWAFFPPSGTRGPRWEVAVSPGSSPQPRAGHVAIFDRNKYRIPGETKMRMIVFGGQGADSLMNNIWWLSRDHVTPFNNSYTWTRLLPASGPSPRSGAAAAYDGQWDRIDVFGGSTAAGYTAESWAFRLADNTWIPLPMRGTQFHAGPPARAGLSAVFDANQGISQYPERFDPTATGTPPGSWSTIDAPQTQFSYSFMFLLPNGKLFYGGPSTSSYQSVLDLATGWESPRSGDVQQFGSAVMYRPGKVLRCGALDYVGGVTGSSRTQVIEFTPPDWTDNGWQTLQSALAPRANPNLTMLPTGDIVATGGTDGSTPEKRPQIWSVAAQVWSDPDALASDPAIRNYHSAAALLPDARVLSTGGDIGVSGQQSNPDALKATIFEPPYLFDASDHYATRPGIGDVPQRLRYGNQFSICMSPSQTIGSVCLIRPAAVTHAFDQNQRYVLLNFAQSSTRLTVTAPADSFTAPPGDYMLFIVSTQGVPSIARWTRVGSVWNTGDMTPPDSVADLGADAVSSNTIYWAWTVPGDDHASGQPWQHKLVHSSSPITDASFANSSPVPNLPVPGCVASTQGYARTGLAACTYYYAALQVVDESNNYSPIGHSPPIRTLCGGGGGGGEVAHQAREESQGPRGGTPRPSALSLGATAASLPPGGATSVLVADFRQGGTTTTWTIYRADPAGLGGAATLDPTRITFQEADGAGGWRTRRELPDLPADLGLRSSTKLGRVILPATYQLKAIETRPPGFDLATAQSSLLGALATDSSATAATVTLAAGDTLRLTFTSTTAGGERGEDCFFIASRPLVAGELSGRRAPSDERGQDFAFALSQNQPNPFSARTTIRFDLPAAMRVRLEVFDLVGRRVRTLVDAPYDPGEHQVTWDRRTGTGEFARPGLYFYRIEAAGLRAEKRMLVLR